MIVPRILLVENEQAILNSYRSILENKKRAELKKFDELGDHCLKNLLSTTVQLKGEGNIILGF